MIYRMSIDASLAFSVEAESEEQAIELARAALNDPIPERIEVGGEYEICVYPGGDDENLEVQTSFERPTPSMLASPRGWEEV